MNNRRDFASIKQLIWDTFRQAWASGIFGMMLAVTAICVVLCLSLSVSGDAALHGSDEQPLFLPHSTPENIRDAARQEGVDTVTGQMTLAFGAISFPVARERGDSVRFLELLLSGGVAGSFGLLLALVWTAGFLPTFLEANAASVLLAKPVGRWRLLVGKYIGVLTFVGFQVVLFVVLTWLALGLRTNVWDMTYWWCIALLLLQFAALYSFSVLLAVTTRSTVACVFGSLLFWLLAWGINYGSVMTGGMEESQRLFPVALGLTKAAYWISPKPIDAGLILYNALDAHQDFEKPVVFKLLESEQTFSPALPLLSSLAIAVVLLALSAYEFNTKDY
jgi:ABC-type transport system involved in multi-copper enzyme maturation permease subunit